MTEVMGSSDTESLVRINNNMGEPGLESLGEQVRVWRVRDKEGGDLISPTTKEFFVIARIEGAWADIS